MSAGVMGTWGQDPRREEASMPQQAWDKKRERQHEHIKEGLEGRSKMSKKELEQAVGR